VSIPTSVQILTSGIERGENETPHVLIASERNHLEPAGAVGHMARLPRAAT
jgi:hypothetical protein